MQKTPREKGQEEPAPPGHVLRMHPTVPGFKPGLQKMHLLQQNNQRGTFAPVSTASQVPRSCRLHPTHPRLALSVGPQRGNCTSSATGMGSSSTVRLKCHSLKGFPGRAQPHPAPALLRLSLPSSDQWLYWVTSERGWETFSKILGGICTEDGYAAAPLLWLGDPGPNNHTRERTPGTVEVVTDLSGRLFSAVIVCGWLL